MGRTAEVVTCRACGVRLPTQPSRWWWQRQVRRSICLDPETCIERIVENMVGARTEDWSVSDIRPDDLYVCATCKGDQEVPEFQDWETGSLKIIACPRCHGTGVDPGW